jgi:hypothetical protein
MKGETFRFENFQFVLPDLISQKILVKLYEEDRGVYSTEIRDFLYSIHVEGFDVNLAAYYKNSKNINKSDGTIENRRKVAIVQNIRLEKKFLWNLENSGYIRREKVGRNNKLFLTESGRYVACISGLIGLKKPNQAGS